MSTHAASSEQRRIDQLLSHYATSHQHPHNQKIHFFAIPLIVLTLCGMLYAVHPLALYAFLLASLVYYARLSFVFLVSMMVWAALIVLIVESLGKHVLGVSVVLFVISWIAQFIGHNIEGKRPSFFEDIQYLWIGPVFILSKLYKKIGLQW